LTKANGGSAASIITFERALVSHPLHIPPFVYSPYYSSYAHSHGVSLSRRIPPVILEAYGAPLTHAPSLLHVELRGKT
jgi:hypothetical protein